MSFLLDICFIVQYFVSYLVFQSSCLGGDGWLLCFCGLLNVIFLAVLLLWIICFLFVSCVSHAFASVHCCCVVTCWERADLLALVGDVNCIFVTFLCGILSQVCYLIVLFPDLCFIFTMKINRFAYESTYTYNSKMLSAVNYEGTFMVKSIQ